jgi:hypothetical protein
MITSNVMITGVGPADPREPKRVTAGAPREASWELPR